MLRWELHGRDAHVPLGASRAGRPCYVGSFTGGTPVLRWELHGRDAHVTLILDH